MPQCGWLMATSHLGANFKERLSIRRAMSPTRSAWATSKNRSSMFQIAPSLMAPLHTIASILPNTLLRNFQEAKNTNIGLATSLLRGRQHTKANTNLIASNRIKWNLAISTSPRTLLSWGSRATKKYYWWYVGICALRHTSPPCMSNWAFA